MSPTSQAHVFLTVEPKKRGVLPMYPMSQALVTVNTGGIPGENGTDISV